MLNFWTKKQERSSDNKLLRLWCSLGFIVSLYATYVEIKLIFNTDYKALCDLAPQISCTSVFSSSYGKGFGFLNNIVPASEPSSIWNPPNGIFGILYYGTLYATANINHRFSRIFQLLLCILSNIMSIYLGYILYVLGQICVVCISIYIINFLCLWEILKNGQNLWTQSLQTLFNRNNLKSD